MTNATPLMSERPSTGMGMIDDAVENRMERAARTRRPLLGRLKRHFKKGKAGGVGEMSAQLRELVMGRRALTGHGAQRIDPDEWYNENDNVTVMDEREMKAAIGLGAGAGAFGTPAGDLISGYSGPTLSQGKFPYDTGVGQAKATWQSTGISLGTDSTSARQKFEAMLPQLKTSDPAAEFKMGAGSKVTVVKIQRRRAGFFWDTVVTIPNPTDEAVRAFADAYKQKHPDVTLRTKKAVVTDNVVLKR